MDYAKFYFKDYRHDTRGLDPLHHGVYLLLLFEFLESERPLPDDLDELYCKAEARTEKEREAVRKILKRFWVRLEDGWIQKLAFVTITDFRNGLAVKKANGMGITGARKVSLEFTVAKRTLGDALADCERSGSESLLPAYQIKSDSLAVLINQESGIRNHKPRTNNQPPGAVGGAVAGSLEQWSERIVATYPRQDHLLENLALVFAVLRSGAVEPAAMLASVERIATAAGTLPGGANNAFVWTAGNFWSGGHWREPGAFELRCQAKVEELKKNKGAATGGGQGDGDAGLLVPAGGGTIRVPAIWRAVWPLVFDADPPEDFHSLPAVTQRELVTWCTRLENEPADDRWRAVLLRICEADGNPCEPAEAGWAQVPLEMRFRILQLLEKKI